MSKKLGWAIKLISWFAIYFIIHMLFRGDMPFWAYLLVVFLCVVVQFTVESFVKKDDPKDKATAANTEDTAKKDAEKPTE